MTLDHAALDRLIARALAAPDTGPGAGWGVMRALASAGIGPVAGVDEVGRGPLAGPVVAAAVILDACWLDSADPASGTPTLTSAAPSGFLIDDSKRLTRARREAAFARLMDSCSIGVGSASAADIDRMNIRQATHLAMRRALRALPVAPALALIDGNDIPEGLGCPALAIVRGDSRVAAIAAASIIAKVLRDAMMAAAAATYPGYGFADHAGYGVPAHLRAIAQRGPCPLHRLSFAPLKHRRP